MNKKIPNDGIHISSNSLSKNNNKTAELSEKQTFKDCRNQPVTQDN
jgi:hypothetical protein